MQALVEKGYKVIALVPSGEYSEKFKDFGIIHTHYDIKRASLNPLNEIKTIFEITKIIKDIKPDILHTFTAKPNIYGAVAGKLAKVPKIYITITGLGSFFIDNSLRSKIIKNIILILYKIASKFATKVLFQNSDDEQLFVDQKIVQKSKTVMIGSSGIDTDKWQKTSDQSHKTINILFVGRLIRHKGIFELLEAYTNLQTDQKSKLTIVGDIDPNNPSSITADQIERYKNIEFVGWSQNTIDFYNKADIFVLPSYREGVPRTIIEAMSMNLAVITTDTVGCKDTIDHNISGILIPVGDTEALKNALERLINDRDLREKFAKNARQKATDQFDIKTVISRYLEIYNL